MSLICLLRSLIFFFNYTATTEIYTLSLHDALPISVREPSGSNRWTSQCRLLPTCARTCRSLKPPRSCAASRNARMSLTSRSEEHTSELQSQFHLVCRLLLEKKKNTTTLN